MSILEAAPTLSDLRKERRLLLAQLGRLTIEHGGFLGLAPHARQDLLRGLSTEVQPSDLDQGQLRQQLNCRNEWRGLMPKSVPCIIAPSQ